MPFLRTGTWVDLYQTVLSSQPLNCDPRSLTHWDPIINIELASTHVNFFRMVKDGSIDGAQSALVAAWIFALTERRDGPLGRADQLVVTSLSAGERSFLSGFMNRGVFRVQSPDWEEAMIVKFAYGAHELQELAKRMGYPAMNPRCLLPPLSSSKMEHAEISTPALSFGVPLAMGEVPEFFSKEIFGTKRNAHLVLMREAPGRQLLAPPHGEDETSVAGQRIFGRAMSQMHLPYVDPEKGSIFHQESFLHNDLHHGNVFIDIAGDRATFIDFEKASYSTSWPGELRSAAGSLPVMDTARRCERVARDDLRRTCCERLRHLTDLMADGCVSESDDRHWFWAARRWLAFREGYVGAAPDAMSVEVVDFFESLCRAWEGSVDCRSLPMTGS